jgi:hypothetical protein
MNEQLNHSSFVDPPVLLRKTYVGIDNGFSGAVVTLFWDGRIGYWPVHVIDLGKDKYLDVEKNRDAIRDIVQANGGSKERVVVVCEHCNPNPIFGSKNNHTNGRNSEFWRVLLSLEEIPFLSVYPQVWQKSIFRGLHGTKTKAMARLVRQQRFPHLDLSCFNREQAEAIDDALCIALWGREANK